MKNGNYSRIKKKGIGVLGPEGTFTQEAAEKYDKTLKPIFFETIKEIIDSLSLDEIERAIVPVENSIQGTIRESFDGIYEKNLNILTEVIIPIRHSICFLKKGILKEDISEIYAHPQTFSQTKKYLDKNFSKAKRIFEPSNSVGFKKISDERRNFSAAIGPKIAAQIYNLEIFQENIQDRENNQTRFFVLNKISGGNTKKNKKTTIVLNPKKDYPGLLNEILELFKKNNLNLSMIESRPLKEKIGKYIFYITLDTGNLALLKKIEGQLAKISVQMTILGSYNSLEF
jgi:prephenate dehydratase